MISIKGLEIPKNCEYCKFNFNGCILEENADTHIVEGLPYNCPLSEIVTCKECKYNGTMSGKCFMYNGNEYMSFHNPNFWCADAERR